MEVKVSKNVGTGSGSQPTHRGRATSAVKQTGTQSRGFYTVQLLCVGDCVFVCLGECVVALRNHLRCCNCSRNHVSVLPRTETDLSDLGLNLQFNCY